MELMLQSVCVLEGGGLETSLSHERKPGRMEERITTIFTSIPGKMLRSAMDNVLALLRKFADSAGPYMEN
jgi:hypothetical protein